MTKKATLLWVDLEMTGLSPVEDRILEVAAIATDWDFNELGCYTGIVKVNDELIKMVYESTKEEFLNAYEEWFAEENSKKVLCDIPTKTGDFFHMGTAGNAL